MRDLTLAEVEHEIISAIEATTTPDKMGPQSPIWEKVYAALEALGRKAKST